MRPLFGGAFVESNVRNTSEFVICWEGWIRTNECLIQSQVPCRLATSQDISTV
jgi:hypothetical protein